MIFESKRIKLRKMTKEDIPTYNIWSNDEEVVRTTYPNLERYTLEDTEIFYSRVTKTTNSRTFMIVDKVRENAIGIISLINMDLFNRNAEFIIDIGDKDYWGKGIGKEAMSLILDYGFKELNLHRIYLRVYSFNERAIKLYEKKGFVHEGKMIEAIFRDGKYHDIVIMGILQRNYLSK
ncbi:GNAT family protein [Clostridiaceae bacterium M8S5]|nr:GNAT family protein [Clostridiaceae bacterium M8S5]